VQREVLTERGPHRGSYVTSDGIYKGRGFAGVYELALPSFPKYQHLGRSFLRHGNVSSSELAVGPLSSRGQRISTSRTSRRKKERKRTTREGWEDGTPPPKERKKTANPREGWEDGTPPPTTQVDFKERVVMR